MDAVLYPLAVYTFLLFLARVAGKRSLSQATVFDFVLVLIIAEATQQALPRRGVLAHARLPGRDDVRTHRHGPQSRQAALEARRPPYRRHAARGCTEDGKLIAERARRERIDEQDVLEAARSHHGLERLDQVQYAVLERDGSISIVPKR